MKVIMTILPIHPKNFENKGNETSVVNYLFQDVFEKYQFQPEKPYYSILKIEKAFIQEECMVKHKKIMQIIITGIIALTLLSGICLAGFFTVAGESMEPALKAGKKVWTSGYGKTEPARGDIIVFKALNMTLLKRVIGLPGEKVVIKEGAVYIVDQSNQEQKLDEPYLAEGITTGPDGEFSVPAGCYFVLGDKRNASRDSRDREMGSIPLKNIVGKVTKVF